MQTNSGQSPEQDKGTKFSKAWSDYQKSKDYAESQQVMREAGIISKYANNILFLAFMAGWNAKAIEHESGKR